VTKQLAHDYFFSGNEHLIDYPQLILEFPMEFSALYPLKPQIDWRYCLSISFTMNIGWKSRRSIWISSQASENWKSPLRFNGMSQLPAETQRKWDKFKRLSSAAITPGMRPKKWRPLGEGAWAFRIDDNFRAHLRFHPGEQKWTALEIGDHAEMDHG
jgi:hypothetical protein